MKQSGLAGAAEKLINIGGDNKTPQGAGERLEWEMENKGKPQGFQKTAVVALHKPPPLLPNLQAARVCNLRVQSHCRKY